MEVIVDDTQLSLAIGKKGQNVRLAAKLLGWKIDIKSEEEKRQEVESAMAALVPAGAPVSVLIDHGLAEEIVEKLIEGGVGHGREAGLHDAGRIGSHPGHRAEQTVEKILIAVNAYYAQFEPTNETAELPLELAEPGAEASDAPAGEATSAEALGIKFASASDGSESAETAELPA